MKYYTIFISIMGFDNRNKKDIYIGHLKRTVSKEIFEKYNIEKYLNIIYKYTTKKEFEYFKSASFKIGNEIVTGEKLLPIDISNNFECEYLQAKIEVSLLKSKCITSEILNIKKFAYLKKIKRMTDLSYGDEFISSDLSDENINSQSNSVKIIEIYPNGVVAKLNNSHKQICLDFNQLNTFYVKKSYITELNLEISKNRLAGYLLRNMEIQPEYYCIKAMEKNINCFGFIKNEYKTENILRMNNKMNIKTNIKHEEIEKNKHQLRERKSVNELINHDATYQIKLRKLTSITDRAFIKLEDTKIWEMTGTIEHFTLEQVFINTEKGLQIVQARQILEMIVIKEG